MRGRDPERKLEDQLEEAFEGSLTETETYFYFHTEQHHTILISELEKPEHIAF